MPAKGQVVTCGPENVAEFNARLRAEMPELYALAKALHERGMIDGLGGARIGPLGALPAGVQPVTSAEAEKGRMDREWVLSNRGRK